MAVAESFKSLVLILLSEKCYEQYFESFHFTDVECFKATLSKGLGLGIIAGSVLVKLPQILKISSNKSGEGINIFGVFLELFALTASFAYSFLKGFPFSAWGEGIFLSIQTAAIATLVLHYGGSSKNAFMFISTYVAIVSTLVSGFTPIDILWSLQAMNVPVVLAGKLIQAYTNYKNGSTGQLSAATVTLLFLGSLMRIFTSIQETGDFIMIITFCASSFANGMILAQVLYYWNSAPAKKLKSKKDS